MSDVPGWACYDTRLINNSTPYTSRFFSGRCMPCTHYCVSWSPSVVGGPQWAWLSNVFVCNVTETTAAYTRYDWFGNQPSVPQVFSLFLEPNPNFDGDIENDPFQATVFVETIDLPLDPPWRYTLSTKFGFFETRRDRVWSYAPIEWARSGIFNPLANPPTAKPTLTPVPSVCVEDGFLGCPSPFE